jgi:hypothetical protein
MERNTPSAVGERHILPVQTNKTDVFLFDIIFLLGFQLRTPALPRFGWHRTFGPILNYDHSHAATLPASARNFFNIQKSVSLYHRDFPLWRRAAT